MKKSLSKNKSFHAVPARFVKPSAKRAKLLRSRTPQNRSFSRNVFKIGQAAKALGVSIDTLRRWEKTGKITAIRTPGGTRLYSLSALEKVSPAVSQRIAGFKAQDLTTEELLRKTEEQTIDSGGWKVGIEDGKSKIEDLSSTNLQESILNPLSSTVKKSLITRFLLGSAVLSVITLLLTSSITASYFMLPQQTHEFFKNNVAAGLFLPFQKLAEETITVIAPGKARELGLTLPEEPPPIPISDLRAPTSDILAVTAGSRFLEANADTQINGSLYVRDSINNLIVEATPAANTFALTSGETTLTVTNDALLDQDVSTRSSPTFNALNLSAAQNQLVLQSGGPAGSLTWTPTAIRTITFPDATGTVVLDAATQTLTNKSMSGSSNTFTSIPNSALSNSKITINTSSGLSGGGDVSLGGSISLTSTDTITSVSNSDGSLTISPTTGAVVASLNVGHSNTWTANQTFSANVGIGQSLTVTSAAALNTLNVSGISNLAGNVGIGGSLTINNPVKISRYDCSGLSNNGKLSTDSSGNLVCLPDSAASLSGGAQNGVAYWDSSSTLSHSIANFYWDPTNYRLGIGTSSPQYRLDVAGTGYFSGFVGIGSSLNVSGNVGVGGSITGYGALNGLNVTGLSNLAGLNATTITASGNVGIGGSANISSYLSAGTIYTPGSITVGNGFQVDSAGDIRRINNIPYSFPSSQAAGANYVLANDSSGNLSWQAVSGVGGVSGTGASGAMTFWNGTSTVTHDVTQLFWDDSNNRLGIGTSSPQYKLDVSGTGYFSGFVGIGSSLNVAGNVGVGGSITGYGALNGLNVTGLSNLAGLNATTINATGNVGVGGSLTVSNPVQISNYNCAGLSNNGKLSTDSSGNLVCLPDTAASISGGQLNGVAYWDSTSTISNSVANFYWDPTNFRLGIGTSSPQYRLDVNGTGYFSGFVGIGSSLNVAGNVGVGQSLNVTSAGVFGSIQSNGVLNVAGNSYLKDVYSTTLTTTGNVGVGGSITGYGALSGLNVTGLTNLSSLNATGNVGLGSSLTVSSGVNLLSSLNVVGLTSLAGLNTSGNVGVGGSLTVQSAVNLSGLGTGTGTGLCLDSANNVVTCTAGIGAVTGTGHAGGVTYWNGTSTVTDSIANFYWDPTNYRLGIGISSPQYRLDVNGTGYFSGFVGIGSSLNVSGNVGIGQSLNVTSAGVFGSIQSNGVLNVAGNSYLKDVYSTTLTTTGNVGVGGSITGYGNLNGLNVTGLSNLSSLNVTGISQLTGNVGIGSSLTVTSLTLANGGVSTSQLCLTGDCRTAWPATVTGESTTASNGLTLVGYDVRLGGMLTQATGIDINNQNFGFLRGNVGIGTTAADYNFKVVGTGYFSDFLGVGTSLNVSGNAGIGQSLNVTSAGVFGSIQSNGVLNVAGNSYLKDVYSTTLTTTGNVGVGGSLTSTGLGVFNGGINVSGLSNLTGNVGVGGTGVFNSLIQGLSGLTVAGSTSLADTRLTTLTTTGNVSIGSSLTVSSTGAFRLSGQNCSTLTGGGKLTTDASGNVYCSADSGSGVTSGTGAAGAVTFWDSASTLSNSVANFYWDSTNNRLGIGTSSPQYRLDVNGTGYFSGFVGIGSSLNVSGNVGVGQSLTVTSGTVLSGGLAVTGGSVVLPAGSINNSELENSSISVTATAGTGISVSGSPVSLGGTLTVAGIDASTTVKGVASFNSTNFTVSSGAVNTIQDIATTSSPTFNNLTLTGNLGVGGSLVVTGNVGIGKSLTVTDLGVFNKGLTVTGLSNLTGNVGVGGTATFNSLIQGLSGLSVSGFSNLADTRVTTLTATGNATLQSAVSLTGLSSGTGSALCLNSSNNVVTCTVGSGGVSGSGYIGGLAFFDSSSNITASPFLFWNNSTSRLGVGTSSPTYTLDVVGAARFSDFVGIGSSLNVTGNVGVGQSLNVTSAGVFGSIQDNGPLVVSGTSYLQDIYGKTLTTTGNVGIGGTTTLNNPLVVNSQVKITGGDPGANKVLTSIDSSGLAIWSSIGGAGGITGSGTANYVSKFDSSSSLTNSAIWSDTSGNVGIGTTSPSQLFQINYSSVNPVVITSAGNVGIGFTSPSNTFTVGTTNQFQIDSSGDIRRIRNIPYSFPSSQGALNTVLTNDSSGNLTWTSLSGAGGITGSGTAGGLSYFTDTSAVTSNAANLFWDISNSRLGIGTSSPQYKLDVAGTGYFSGFVGIGSSLNVTGNVGVGGSLTVTSAAALNTLNVTGISNLAGNVGVGGSLTVNNPVRISSYDCSGLSNNGKLSTDSFGNLVCLPDTAASLSGGAQNGVAFWDSTSTLSHSIANFYWDPTNYRLGIGTSSPQYRLDVAGTGYFSGFVGIGSSLNVSGNVGIGQSLTVTSGTVLQGGLAVTGGSVILPAGSINNSELENSSINVTATAGTGISVSGSPVSLGGTLTVAGIDASTTVKGVASFNSTNFTVSSGAVNTIQDIATTSSPTFNNLTLTGNLGVGGSLVVTGNVGIGKSLTVTDLGVFNKGLTVSGLTNLTGNVGIGGTATFNSLIQGLSGLNVSGFSNLSDTRVTTLTATGNTTLQSAVSLTGLSSGTGSALCLNSSNNVVTCTVGSGGVSGSGYIGGLAFFDSSSNITASPFLFWNNSTSRLGVGTSSPTYTLDVVGAARFSDFVGIGSSLNVTGNVGIGQSLNVTSAGVFGSIQDNGVLNVAGNTYLRDTWADDITSSTLTTTGNVGVGGSITGFGALSGLNVTGLANLSSLNVTGISQLTGNVGIGNSLTVTSLTLANGGVSTSQLCLTGDCRTAWPVTVTGESTTASNGLTLTGYDVRLGGMLTQATGIDINNQSFGFLRGNVGIGTTGPGSSLQVAGTIDGDPNSAGVHLGMNANFGGIELAGSSGGYLDFTVGDGTDRNGRIIYTHSDHRMKFQTGGTDKMTIDTTGNVGIGTTSPNSKLSVVGNAIISQSYSGITVPTSGLFVEGNVGIGATTSSNKLDVWGGARITNGLTLEGLSSAAATALCINSSNQVVQCSGSSALTGTGVNGGVTYWTGSNTLSNSVANFYWDNTNYNLGIGTSTPGTARLAVMGGNVGIGTTSPAVPLHILGTDTTNGQARIGYDTSNYLKISGISTGAFTIDPVGTSPQLNIYDVNSIVSPSGAYLQLRGAGASDLIAIMNTDNATAGNPLYNSYQFVLRGSYWDGGTAQETLMKLQNITSATTPVYRLGIFAGSSEKVSIDNSGNVGIGFTAPDRITQIASDINITSSVASLLGTNGSQFAITGSTANNLQKKLTLGLDTTDNYGVIQAGHTDGTGYNLSLNPGGGNVGIGTTTPGAKLEVSGGNILLGNNQGYQIKQSGGTAVTLLTMDANNVVKLYDGGGGFISRLSGGGLTVGYENTNAPSGGMIISGNVGIGLTTANSQLSVSNNVHIGSLYQGTVAPTNGLFVDGNVGIGATTSSNKLDVWGGARITNGLTLEGLSSSAATALCINSSNQVVQCSGSSALSGTGVNGGVTYWTGTNTLADSVANFYWDPTNFRLGIGTSNPLSTLQIGSSLALDGKTLSFSTLTGNLGIGTTTPGSRLSVAGGVGIGVSFANSVVPSNGLAIQGNVGIGTTSPNNRIQVVDLINFNNSITGTFLGYQAGNVTSGADNTFVGYQAGLANISGASNSAFGSLALLSNTTGSSNSAFGVSSLRLNTTGGDNSAFGAGSLQNNSTGNRNSAFGSQALTTNNAGTDNAVFGYNALNYNSTGSYNSVFGTDALSSGTRSFNSAFGYRALWNLGIGTSNATFGYQSGFGLTDGGANTLIGTLAGQSLTTGSNNIVIGYNADALAATLSNNLNIGNLLFGTGLSSGTGIASGNIGIGTSTPRSTLEIAGNLSIGFTGPNVGSIPSLGLSVFGNVGIGTTSPTNALQVVGNVGIGSSLTTTGLGVFNGGINVSGLSNLTGNVGIGGSLTVNNPVRISNYNCSGLSNDGKLSTDSSGNLVCLPDTAASLSGGAQYGVTFWDSSSTLSHSIANFYWDPTNFRLGIGTSAPTGLLHVGSSPALPPLYIPSATGNVGIGTTGPTAALDVNGSINLYGQNGMTVNLTTGSIGIGRSASGTGAGALRNTLVGDQAGMDISSGDENAVFGYQAYQSSNSSLNSVFGYQAMQKSTNSSSNAAFGYQALQNDRGGNSSAFGYQALQLNTTGTDNSAFGFQALQVNTTGGLNSAFGVYALVSNTTGSNNAAFGYQALSSNDEGSNNSAFGVYALLSNSTGKFNSAFGYYSGTDINTGYNNVTLGYLAGDNVTTGSNNIFIGAGSKGLAATTGSIGIGFSASVTGNNQLVIGGTDANGLIREGYFGSGVTNTSPANFTLNATGGSGTNIAGASLILAAGKSTGSASGGNLLFAVSPAGASGSSLNSLFLAGGFDSNGNLGIGTTAATAKLQIQGNVGIGYTGVAIPVNGLAVLGNVGIGTTTANNALQVVGNVGIGSSLTTTGLGVFNGGINVSGLSNLTGNVGIGGSLTVNNPVRISSYNCSGLSNSGKLSTDSSGNLVCLPDTAASLSGGAQNGVAFWDSSSTLSHSIANFYWDPTNFRLGIGTSAPTGLLHVGSSPAIPPLYIPSATGNVGIGTTGPTAPLSVGSSSQFQVSSIGTVTVTSTATATSYTNPGGSGDRRSMITVTSNVTLGEGTWPRLVDGDLSTANFYWNNQTAADKYITFDFGNSYGITEAKFYEQSWSTGTHGTWQWQGSTDNTNWTNIGDTFTLGINNTTLQTQTTLSANTTSYRFYRILGISGNMSNGPYIYQFEFKISTVNSTSVLTSSSLDINNKLNVLAGGNVGIGIITPVAQLDLRNTNTSTGLHMYVGSSAGQFGILDNGNVGIGTTLPAYNLQVMGTANFGNVGVGGSLVTSGNVGVGGSLTATGLGVFNGGLNVSGLSNLTGNVGVGGSLTVNNPVRISSYNCSGLSNNGKLSTDSSGNLLCLPDTAASLSGGAQNGVAFWDSSSTLSHSIANFYWDPTNFSLGIGTSTPGGKLSVMGNVGIGFTTPDRSLQLGSDINITTTLASLLGTNGTQLAITGSTANNLQKKLVFGLDTTDNYGVIQVGSGSTGYPLYLNPVAGNIGIGTSITTDAVVIGKGGGSLYLETDIVNDTSSNAGTVKISDILWVNGNVGIGTSTANSNLSVAGSAHIGTVRQGVVAPTDGLFVDGNVGIGATTSSNKLDVWGNTRLAGTLTVDSTSSFGGNLTLASGQFLTLNGTASLPSYSFTNSTSSGLWSPSTNVLSLTTNGSGTSGITITAAGNVGIGITTANSALTVNGGVSIGSSNITAPTNGLFVLGNVGIGFTSPQATLYIQGSVDSNMSSSQMLQVQAQNGTLSGFSTNSNSLPAVKDTHSSVVANGYVYVIGGRDSSGDSTTTVYYAKLNSDGSIGTWSTNSNALPGARHGHSSVVANGYVYVIGGATASGGTTWNSTVYYAKLNSDGSVGTWNTSSNSLPDLRSGHSSVVANGYVYVMGGRTNTTAATTNVYYAKLNSDGSTGSWSTNGNSLPAVRQLHSSVIANGYVYVFGGANSASSAQSTIYYAKLNSDGSIGSWSTNSNALPAVRSSHSSVVANGYVYVIGGIDNVEGGTVRSTVYYAKLNSDGSVGSWSTNTNSLPAVRQLHSSVIANGYIYALGGNNSTNPQTTVYYTSAPRVSMAASLDLLGLTSYGLSDTDSGQEGGSIFAGNLFLKDSLEVGGLASFWEGAGFFGPVSIGVGATSNSSPLFSITSSSSLTGATTNLFQVFSNGNVGIGSTAALTPSSLLWVGGNVGIGWTGGSTSPAMPSLGLSVFGNMGIGTTSPNQALDVVGSARFSAVGSGTSTNDLRITADGTLTTQGSDISLKTNLEPLQNSLERVMQLQTYSFNWIDSPNGPKDIGLVAQEVAPIIPEITFTNPVDGKMGINYSKFAPILISAIQEQQAEINSAINEVTSFNLSVGPDGNLTTPALSVDQLVINSEAQIINLTTYTDMALPSDTALVFAKPNYMDVAASLVSLDQKVSIQADQLAVAREQTDVLSVQVASQSATLADLQNQIASLSAQLVATSSASSSTSAILASPESTSSAIPSAIPTPTPDASSLNLTPPEILLATQSAQLVHLEVTSDATISGLLTTYDLDIQNSLRSFGSTTLGSTTIAGDLTVDGTMSISGNSLSVLGTLSIQNGPLAESVDFFNGLVTIDKTGKVIAQSIETPELITQKLTISNTPMANSPPADPTIGSDRIVAGSTKVAILSNRVSSTSKIFITPKSSTQGETPYVELIEPGVGFVVSIDKDVKGAIDFDWWIVETQ